MRKTNTLLCLENNKPFFCLYALKQTKAGLWSSGTPVLVSYNFKITRISDKKDPQLFPLNSLVAFKAT